MSEMIMRSKEEIEKFNATNFSFSSTEERQEWMDSDDPLPKRYVEEMKDKPEKERKLYQEPLESVGELDTTVDAWRSILNPPEPEGYTILELVEMLKIPETTLRRRLRVAGGRGLVQECLKRNGTSVYQLTGEEE